MFHELLYTYTVLPLLLLVWMMAYCIYYSLLLHWKWENFSSISPWHGYTDTHKKSVSNENLAIEWKWSTKIFALWSLLLIIFVNQCLGRNEQWFIAAVRFRATLSSFLWVANQEHTHVMAHKTCVGRMGNKRDGSTRRKKLL